MALRLVARRRDTGSLARLNAAQEPRHVFAEGAHGLQPLLVAQDLLRRVAVDLIPVLRGDDRHGVDAEIFVQTVKGSAGTAAATGDNGGCGLSRQLPRSAVEQAVEEGARLRGGTGVIDRRTDNNSVELLQSGGKRVHAVVKNAGGAALAAAAGNALGDRPGADVDKLGVDAVLFQGCTDLIQRGICTALRVRASVQQQNLHELRLQFQDTSYIILEIPGKCNRKNRKLCDKIRLFPYFTRILQNYGDGFDNGPLK